MKTFTVALVVICVVGWGFIAYQLHGHSQSSALMPGQTLVIENSSWVDLDIQSEYPVTIDGLDCRVPRTAEAHITCGPSSVTITDARPRLLIWGRTNVVRWKASVRIDQR